MDEEKWAPQVNPKTGKGPQKALLAVNASDIFEVMYGGARGGGKTDGMLGDFAVHSLRYGKDAHGIFVRRRAKHLENVIRRSFAIYRPMGARFVGGNELTWRFLNGATLRFRHLWADQDAEDYQGHDYTRVYCEELTQWPTSGPTDKMKATARSAAGVPVGFRATGNPGGPGHNWVKARYIDPAPKGYKRITDRATGLKRVFIPARLEDNRILLDKDPNYEQRLQAAGPKALVKAWRWGLWDIVAGGFFDHVWNPDRHILQAFTPPASWRLRRSHDWGSAKPASTGWWAISDGQPLPDDHPLYPGRVFPRGSLIRLFEWYTVALDEGGNILPNVGTKLSNEALGRGIAERSEKRPWSGCVADPQIWAESGGRSIYAQMRKGALDHGLTLSLRKADTERVAGWKLMSQMLEESAKEVPEGAGLWVMDTNTHFIRTVPVLQMDEKHPDDIDTDAEDHVADETRYACMSAGRGLGSSKPLTM
jgi:hypothetical protein